MKLSRGFQLIVFLGWSMAIVSLSALAGKTDPADLAKDELVQEVERLQSVDEVNSGRLDSDVVGLSPALDREEKKSVEGVKPTHLATRRSLSQR